MDQNEHAAGTASRGDPGRRRRRKKSSTGLKVLLWIVIIGISASLLSLFVLNAANDAFGFGKPDHQVELTIPKGVGSNEVATLLKNEGVIEQSLTFRLYSLLRNREGIIQAGDYIFNSNMSYDQIIVAMRTGDTIKEEVKVTFYEGMSALEIARLLEEERVCDATEFLNFLETAQMGFEFEDMLPESDLRFRRLEGYLFPDTYDFYVGENVESITRKFLRNFQARVWPIYDQIQDAGMTLDEAIVLASLIQEEASNEEEMYRVSSVFHNRIEQPNAGLPKLQSDVTIFYVEKDIKPFQTKSTQPIYDAYNTYVCNGLPIGPICSPGLEAILAAIKPEKTDYYFFVTDKSGKYYFSKTLAEHNKNVRIANAVGGSHGTNVS